jgi:hypothetical protein
MSTHANAPLTPEGRRRLWGVGKNAVTSRNRAAVARAKGRLRGKQPKLSAKQQTELRRMHTTGDYSIADFAELFNIGRATVYRTLRRQATSESWATRAPRLRLVTQSLPAPRLCKRIDAGRPHAHVADEGGISRATLTKWYKRWLLHGDPGLLDRTSRPD